MQQAGRSPSAGMGGAPKSSLGSGGMNDRIKQVILIVLPILVSVVAVVYMFLPNYVLKVDNTKAIGDIVNDLNKIKTDTAQSIASMQNTVNGVPAMITNQVNTGVGQATTAMNNQISTIQTQVNNMAGVVAESKSKLANVDALSTKLDTVSAQVTAVKTSVDSEVNTKIAALTSTLQATTDNLTKQIADLQTKVTTLQSQQNLSNITVTTVTSNVSFTNTVASVVGVQVANSGTSAVTVTLKLDLTTATPNISITGIDMNRAFTYTLSNPNVTFYTTVTIEGSSSVTLNPQVRLTYTGTSPNVWNVAWSRQ